jgi:ABC-2 type transport system ATP-binding protein
LNKEEGVTIFISSHLLQEVEKMITHLAIISHGEIRFSGSIKDLNELYRYNHIRIGINNASGFISKIPENYSPKIFDENTLEITVESQKDITNLVKHLANIDAEIFEIKSTAGLEDWFMEITKN